MGVRDWLDAVVDLVGFDEGLALGVITRGAPARPGPVGLLIDDEATSLDALALAAFLLDSGREEEGEEVVRLVVAYQYGVDTRPVPRAPFPLVEATA
jgi:hypothetical protein